MKVKSQYFWKKWVYQILKQVKMQGRSFTANALRNIIQDPSDLIIHRGLQPICEYNNPVLFPGMYPTLFPLG
jgi:hypothetical protein